MLDEHQQIVRGQITTAYIQISWTEIKVDQSLTNCIKNSDQTCWLVGWLKSNNHIHNQYNQTKIVLTWNSVLVNDKQSD